MKLIRILVIVVGFFGLSSHVSFAMNIEPAKMVFSIQENLEPFSRYSCNVDKSSVGLFEYDVRCPTENTVRKFAVHLVVQFHPKTQYGESAYEVMYWVTDWDRPQWRNTSTTVWIHNDTTANRARVIEMFQGIENDMSSLQLRMIL
jgi:hypothetical protein